MDWASEIAKGCGDGVGWGGGNGFVRRNWLPMKVWEGARVWAGEVPSRGGRVWVLYLSSNSGLRAEGRLRGSWIETYLETTCRIQGWWETKDGHFPKSDYKPRSNFGSKFKPACAQFLFVLVGTLRWGMTTMVNVQYLL